MNSKLLMGNNMLLFLFASMYLGTGGSLVLFSFPIAPELTVDNYYLQFVPQVQAATDFFTDMTKLMLVCAGIMLYTEWHQPLRWVPLVVITATVAATGLTLYEIIPLNREMASHITDPVRLKEVLEQWMHLNRIRVSLWCVQWGCMAWYFGRLAWQARYPANEG
jgi:hypothetical protein